MTQHLPHGHDEAAVPWLRRRAVLQAAAAWTATAGGVAGAQAQMRGNIVELIGDVQVNGRAVTADSVIQTGDAITTGPGANLIFTIGNAAFQARQNSRLTVERGLALNTVGLLRVLSGSVGSVWGPGHRRQVITPTLTVNFREAGLYTEVLPDQAFRSYLCNCFGTASLYAGGERIVSRADYHQAFWAEAQPRDGSRFAPAPVANHADEEIEFLAELADRRTAWQDKGRKGVRDGLGSMQQRPPEAHPAAPRG